MEELKERLADIEKNQAVIIQMLTDLLEGRETQQQMNKRHLQQYFETVLAPLKARGMDVSKLTHHIALLMNTMEA